MQEASFTSEPVENLAMNAQKLETITNIYNMKRFVIMMVLAILATSTAVAQEAEHAKFMGIELGGPLEQFESELQKKGFNRTGYDESSGCILYEGRFTGEDVVLWVMVWNDSVALAGVQYEVSIKWHEVTGKYDTLKESLTRKYGKPIEVNEDLYIDFWDISEHGKSMLSVFEIPGGKVALVILADTTYSGAVLLAYADGLTLQNMNQEAFNDL